MKSFLITMILFLTGSLGAQNLLNSPESITFDTLNNRYLVSNVRDSNIVQIESDFVTQSYFKTDLGGPCAGNHIVDDIFFVTVFPKIVKAFDLANDELIAEITTPYDALFDGMTADTSGNLYVNDTRYGCMYKIDISTFECTLFVQGLSASPQDVTFDAENNRLLVCYFYNNSPIHAVSLPDGVLSSVVTTPIGFYDGITHDGKGNTFLASHASNGRVYMYDATFTNPPLLITSLPFQPAGPDYNKRDNILAIPSFGADKVDFLSFNDVDDDGVLDYCDNCLDESNPGQEDTDTDGTGDACDLCPGENDDNDADEDGMPDACDICPGFDDFADADSDGIPDACDICAEFDDMDDFDADTVPDSCDNCPEIANPGQEDRNDNGIGNACDYICGDANVDAQVNIGDAVFLINYIFNGGEPPDPLDAGDANCDWQTNIGDAVYIINYIFNSGAAPCESCS